MTERWEYLRAKLKRLTVRSAFPLVVAALVLCGFSFSGPPAAAQGMPLPSSSEPATEQAQPVVLPEHLTRTEVRNLLSRLSDDQVRQLLLQQLDKVADQEARARAGDQGAGDTLQEQLAAMHGRLSLMVSAIGDLPYLGSFVVDRLAEGRSPSQIWIVLLFAAIVFAGGAAGEWLFRRLFTRIAVHPRSDAPETLVNKLCILLMRAVIDLLGIGVFGLCAAGIFFAFYQDHVPTRMVMAALFWIVIYIRLTNVVARFLLSPKASALRLPPLSDEAAKGVYKRVVVLVSILVGAIFLGRMLDGLGVGEGMSLLIGRIVATIVLGSFGVVIWHDRKVVAQMICSESGEGAEPPGRVRNLLAANWHLLAICYLAAIWVISGVTRLMTGVDAAAPGIISLAIIVVIPIVDWLMRAGLSRMLRVPEASSDTVEAPAGPVEFVDVAEGEPVSPEEAIVEVTPATTGKATAAARAEYQNVLMRNLRIVLAVVVAMVLAKVWDIDIRAAASQGMGETVAGALFDIIIFFVLASAGWGIVKTAINQKIREEEGDVEQGEDMEGEAGGKGGSRLQTLLPLFRKFLLITLVVIVAFMVLSELGIDIGPLIAGAGVVGIAIGFGAQTLVKDIVSGMFFLVDDAFRVGEYIDVGSVRGVVERISIRSLRLRHQNGPVHTVPFGEIQHLTNYSRDWAIMKLEVRVPFDTDMEKVRKIVKKVGQGLMDDPTHGKNFLQPLKSQGVNRMDDSAFIVRVKFMAKPGEQFLLRREVFRRIQEAFAQQGIKFAPRRLIVATGPGEAAPAAAVPAVASHASEDSQPGGGQGEPAQ